jgi:HK97 gp10 family phage protein
MPETIITVVGLEDVQRMLAEAPKIVVANGFLKALSAGANVFADELETSTPEKAEDTGGLLDKGVLRESITIEVELDSQSRGGSADISFGKNGFVAKWVEFGHRMLGHKDKTGEKKVLGSVEGTTVPPHPFVRPAFDAAADRAVEAFTNSIEETVLSQFPQGPT